MEPDHRALVACFHVPRSLRSHRADQHQTSDGVFLDCAYGLCADGAGRWHRAGCAGDAGLHGDLCDDERGHLCLYHADAKGTGEIRVVAGADLNADEFLMWGHNDGSLSNWSEIKDLQEEKLEVLDRSWKISERGDVGLIDLRIEKTELPSVSGKVGLIMAQMADYSDAVILELTDNGTYYSVAVNLQDNAYISFVTAEDFTIGKEEMSPVSNWNLYPNPVENGFTNLSFVSGIHTEASLLVYNQIGGLVEQKNLSIQAGENSFSLEVSSYSTGVYFIQLKGEGLDKVFRMVK